MEIKKKMKLIIFRSFSFLIEYEYSDNFSLTIKPLV